MTKVEVVSQSHSEGETTFNLENGGSVTLRYAGLDFFVFVNEDGSLQLNPQNNAPQFEIRPLGQMNIETGDVGSFVKMLGGKDE